MDVILRGDADGVSRLFLAGHVDLRGGEVTDEDDGERRGDVTGALEPGHPGPDFLEDFFGDDLSVEDQAGMRRRRMSEARPVSGSTTMTTPWRAAGPVAGSKRAGIWERKRWMIRSRFTPITPSVGPVIPRSVMYAVPFGSTRSSAVCTW